MIVIHNSETTLRIEIKYFDHLAEPQLLFIASGSHIEPEHVAVVWSLDDFITMFHAECKKEGFLDERPIKPLTEIHKEGR